MSETPRGLSDSEGAKLVDLARKAVTSTILGGIFRTSGGPRVFDEKRGVFVTISSASGEGERLRGCVGFPYPVRLLRQAVVDAAVAAATEDPRFPPLGSRELGDVIFEVSVLSVPVPVDASPRSALHSKVTVGKHGIIVSSGVASGLLLPQVAVDFGLDSSSFLSQGCLKAGLPFDSWLDPAVKVQTFMAEVFAEAKPRGEVRRLLPGVTQA